MGGAAGSSGRAGPGAVAGHSTSDDAAGSGGFSGSGGTLGSGGTAGLAGSGGQTGQGPALTDKLALGAFHSCAGFEDGRLRCWGTGRYIGAGNDLTIGDDETPDAIPDVAIGGPVQQIAASWYQTCAVLDDGRLRCFGNGLAGQLGYANIDNVGDDEAPASAGDVNVGGKAVSVACGPYHTCAVLDNGKVRCWGRNTYGQLGYRSPETVGDDEPPASAGDVDVGGFVTHVAAGFGHTCVLLMGGEVRCWGLGSGGRLGYGNTHDIGDDESPASAGDVDIGGPVKQLVAGSFHTCALLRTGKVRCWGSNGNGQLGYGKPNGVGDDETPALAGDVDVGGPVQELAAGNYATCALLVGGTVRCWGAGYSGELGYGNTNDVGDYETPAATGDVDLGGPVAHIQVGFLHVCATLIGGRVRCWGRGSTGALGYGNSNDVGDDETPASAGDVKLR